MNKFSTVKMTVPIDKVRPNPYNPNVQDKATFEKEKKSIEEFGLLGSIIVRQWPGPENFEILDGEHRWKACKELGFTEITVESIGEIPDEKMKFFTIFLNNLRGKDDIFKRAALLKEMDSGQQALLPWSAEEIENEKQLLSFDFAQYEKDSDLPVRTPGMLVVLPFNEQESMVWLRAKEELVKRGYIGTDNSKKKQDIQAVMWLIKNIMGLTVGMTTDTVVEFEPSKDSKDTIANDSVRTDVVN